MAKNLQGVSDRRSKQLGTTVSISEHPCFVGYCICRVLVVQILL